MWLITLTLNLFLTTEQPPVEVLSLPEIYRGKCTRIVPELCVIHSDGEWVYVIYLKRSSLGLYPVEIVRYRKENPDVHETYWLSTEAQA